MEELKVGLHLLLGIETPDKFDRIVPMCKLVEEISGVKPATNKPIIGAGNYTRESGIGVDLIMKTPLAMFAMAPRFFGRSGQVVLGKKSGKASITYTLEKLRVQNIKDETVMELLKEVKAAGTAKRSLLTLDEFKKILNRHVK